MNEARRKLLGLFRSKSTSGTERMETNDDLHHRKGRVASNPSRRRLDRSPTPPGLSKPSSRKTSGRENLQRPASTPPQPLTRMQWPPPGVPLSGTLSKSKGLKLVATGAPIFRGHIRAIPHASDDYYMFYATCEGTSENAGQDYAKPWRLTFAAASFTIQDPLEAVYPWETLEQPSMAFCYGTRPGTVTLNHWIGQSSNLSPRLELRDPGVKPREVDLSTILERLSYLEHGFEEDYPDLLYKNLYRTLLHDPDRRLSPHKSMDKQITDLIFILSLPSWIDFSKAENQVAAKFFSNAGHAEQGGYKAFFHQLLLSMELDLRINSKQHEQWAREKLMRQLPPRIAWGVALARKWRQCMAIERFRTGGVPEQIKFHLRLKRSQTKSLQKFAAAMKWPSLPELNALLKSTSPSISLEDLSSDSMTYFTALILPGPTLPFLIMNTLINCTSSTSPISSQPSLSSSHFDALSHLTHMHPRCGFQYRSTTYWTATSIVGKVLAPTCRQVAGWVGPARPAPDLARSQIARVRQRVPKGRLSRGDVLSMSKRSDPLGEEAERYPVADYKLLDTERLPLHEVVDFVRIEKLALKPVIAPPLDSTSRPNSSTSKDPSPSPRPHHRPPDLHAQTPQLFDAAVQFAIDGRSWPLRLSYDVSFVAAHPCDGGPHLLFFDYVFEEVGVDEVVMIRDWGGAVERGIDGNERGENGEGDGRDPVDAEKVLLIDARGVSDNEVLARAWCSHWGLGAVVVDLEVGCKACAIREAYAACLNVVIMVRGRGDEMDEEEVMG